MRRPALRALVIRLAVLLCLPASALAQQEAASVDQAVKLFQEGKHAEAAAMFEELERQNPANYLRLNAMVAWYTAGDCDKATHALGRVDTTLALAPEDVADIDQIEAGCAFVEAEKLADAGRRDEALAALNVIQTRNETVRQKIAALKTRLETQKQQEEAGAKDGAAGGPPVEPPPAPPQRPTWALYGGVGGIGLGLTLATSVVVKHFGFDQPNLRRGLEMFASEYHCTYDAKQNVFGGCSTARVAQLERDPGYVDWQNGPIRTARAITAALTVTAGLSTAVGAAMLIYYATTAPAERSAPTHAVLVPILSPDAPGAALILHF